MRLTYLIILNEPTKSTRSIGQSVEKFVAIEKDTEYNNSIDD